jgi:hypothetical protein
MRRILWVTSILGWALIGLSAQSTTSTTKKKSTTKKSAHPVASASKKSSSTHTRATASKSGKKAPARRVVATHSRQMTPTTDRYKEIQQALSAKGYLTAEQANGRWDDSSSAALKKFQADQNLDANGKINSLSLIALGLGPKRETTAKAPTAAPAAP